ncbi:hypothetical protein GAU_1098 [Gemmatimonas aurantiaca T-27]|uniref:Prepilin-type N-terminal cleavage/methylation domain-containing protein n=1 Tax=Gemmatimonas aurantiaca (strain DSM 14586 / JCM 11422 / NBRC 100505 / T-27) TaxID=379066 RepID=C1A7D0_GEMAT|nr:prepilin-type N-terminal cleavage/methylation domain-containing protein [Gemmatimonas aurantiaca]BAH38140.1 hypothetical protein GAU_1098 [Gemmatimonas aurantiaca T-27]
MKSPTRRRTGFTLLELVIALSLTAVSTGVAASAIWAARRTAEAQQNFAMHGETDARWRALLTDMLRHAPPAERVDRPLLTITATTTGPELRFLSQGVREPFGTGAVWEVVVRQDGAGLMLQATPLARGASGATLGASEDSPGHLVARIPGVDALDIQVLETATGTSGAQWRHDWPLAQTRPAAIALQWQPHGRSIPEPTVTPLIVALETLSNTGVSP